MQQCCCTSHSYIGVGIEAQAALLCVCVLLHCHICIAFGCCGHEALHGPSFCHCLHVLCLAHGLGLSGVLHCGCAPMAPAAAASAAVSGSLSSFGLRCLGC
jgi:hypothetical protein